MKQPCRTQGVWVEPRGVSGAQGVWVGPRVCGWSPGGVDGAQGVWVKPKRSGGVGVAAERVYILYMCL